MLISFLERGMILQTLSRSQMLEVEKAFTWYLLNSIRYLDAAAMCEKVLDPDQVHLKPIIKARLSTMIEDYDCNVLFKPALLRLGAGDNSLFRKLKTSPRRSQLILDTNRKAVRVSLRKVQYPLNIIGPDHVKELEEEHLALVEKHAWNHVSRHAKFLTMGGSGTSVGDMVNDLQLLAMRAFRHYYPFRKGLHLTNTMRATITNRGRGMVKYYTAGVRQRFIMDENYKMVNRENGGLAYDIALDTYDDRSAESGRALDFDIQALANGKGSVAEVAKFMRDPIAQDRFITWLEQDFSISDAADVAEAVQMSGKPYSLLLSRYLKRPRDEVRKAIVQIRKVARE
jgi:hypothetical protein